MDPKCTLSPFLPLRPGQGGHVAERVLDREQVAGGAIIRERGRVAARVLLLREMVEGVFVLELLGTAVGVGQLGQVARAGPVKRSRKRDSV
jgi:hypothetical protein